MKIIAARNVNHALSLGLQYLGTEGLPEESRAGPVLVSPVPVVTVYSHPRERVLFSPLRDANPFFHLAESLWMLAGRGDAAFLNRFIANFGQRFAEPDGRVHGAYGFRWREALGYDQLDYIVKMLRWNPADRQAVLQMWDGAPLMQGHFPPDKGIEARGEDDLRGKWRDRPCNTHVYFRVRSRVVGQDGAATGTESWLDMTVCCRSNDMIMGAYGANAVHFSVLQEYVASMIGVDVGTYFQVSNNFHLYTGDLEQLTERHSRSHSLHSLDIEVRSTAYEGQTLPVRPVRLVDDPGTFMRELVELLAAVDQEGDIENMCNKFLSLTAWPMFQAHRAYRLKKWDDTRWWGRAIEAPDWRRAAVEWLERRERKQGRDITI